MSEHKRISQGMILQLSESFIGILYVIKKSRVAIR